MRNKLDTRDLEIGMYVAELDRPWKGTPFLFQGFTVSSQEILETVRTISTYVLVETNPQELPQKGAPVRSSGPVIADTARSRGRAHRRATRFEPDRVLEDVHVATRWQPEQTLLEEEIREAESLEGKAREVLYSTLEDVRLGKSVQIAGAKEVVSAMVESVIRNPDAMTVLSQLKNVDEYTALHSMRVCILALTFGRHLDLNRTELNLLGVGALLHDVGKMKVPLEILNKPGLLTEAELEIMKSHVPEGVKVLSNSAGITAASIEVAARHHERYSGKGYSNGLAGNDIGSFGMISAIVDCYDAITSDRIYHRGMPPYEALTKMYQWRGSDFHPGLIEQFIQCMGIYPIGSVVELSNGAVGVVVTVNRERRLKPRIVMVLNPDKMRYKRNRILDLADLEKQHGANTPDIVKVLQAGEYNINPVDYLPVRKNCL